jgi:hypothetical protein
MGDVSELAVELVGEALVSGSAQIILFKVQSLTQQQRPSLRRGQTARSGRSKNHPALP